MPMETRRMIKKSSCPGGIKGRGNFISMESRLQPDKYPVESNDGLINYHEEASQEFSCRCSWEHYSALVLVVS